MKSAETSGIQLAYLLPLAELSICWTLLFVVNPDLPRQIRASLHPPPTSKAAETERLEADFGAIDHWRVNATQVVWLENTPGMWAELATSTQTWPDSWFPVGFPDLFAWRAVLWPLASLPFWFSAGRGIDWFLDRHRRPHKIGRLTCLLALFSAAWGALLVLLGLIEHNPALRAPALDQSMSLSGGLWLIFGTITCSASFLQWRESRALRRTKKEAEAQSQSSSAQEEETASGLK